MDITTNKVMILGAGGMLGHVVALHLKERGYKVIAVGRRKVKDIDCINIDVQDQEKLFDFMRRVEPSFVVNCIGALIKLSETHSSKAIYLNSLFPHILAEWSEELKFKLIHISTDCVFSGKSGPYRLSDFKDGQDLYSRSKALGEIIDSDKHVTLRTSIIGPEIKIGGEGLFEWFMKGPNSVNGYTKVWWSGVTTLQLASVIEHVIQNNMFGLHHVSNNTGINKYQLLTLINRVFGLNKHLSPINTPKYSKVLIEGTADFSIPDYETMIVELYNYMSRNSDLYSGYAQ